MAGRGPGGASALSTVASLNPISNGSTRRPDGKFLKFAGWIWPPGLLLVVVAAEAVLRETEAWKPGGDAEGRWWGSWGSRAMQYVRC